MHTCRGQISKVYKVRGFWAILFREDLKRPQEHEVVYYNYQFGNCGTNPCWKGTELQFNLKVRLGHKKMSTYYSDNRVLAQASSVIHKPRVQLRGRCSKNQKKWSRGLWMTVMTPKVFWFLSHKVISLEQSTVLKINM